MILRLKISPPRVNVKEYWEQQALSSDEPLKISRVLPENTPEFISKMMAEFESDVVKFCFDGGRSGLILDAGCGTGNILIHALKLYPESNLSYIGLDFSRNMLKKAITRTKIKLNTSFIQANATDLPFGDNTFDRVICSGVLTYLPSLDEADKTIRECYRILKPNGILIIDFFNKLSPSIVATSILHQSYTKPPKYISPFWFSKELNKVGFNVLSYHGFNFTFFTGYRYLFMGKRKIFDPFFIQERWSRYIEKKILPKIPRMSLFGHRIYVKCGK